MHTKICWEVAALQIYVTQQSYYPQSFSALAGYYSPPHKLSSYLIVGYSTESQDILIHLNGRQNFFSHTNHLGVIAKCEMCVYLQVSAETKNIWQVDADTSKPLLLCEHYILQSSSFSITLLTAPVLLS